MAEQLNCASCGARDVTDRHVSHCADLHRHRDDAVEHGAAYGVPAVTTADLWAHLGHVGSYADATRTVRQVLDLGWRPVVGADPKRLWVAR